jgi:hypothetical protein
MAANVPSTTLQYGNWSPAFFRPHARSIGGIVAQVTIDEQGSDDVQITEHPVEQGAPIADHAFKRPATVAIRAGWTRQIAWDLSAETGVYGLLLSWQAALLPFDVYTGKRKYTNMLIERLQVTTDNHTEFALMATITCRQVIIVSTASTTNTGLSNNPNDQNNPAQTGQESNGGNKQATQSGYSTGGAAQLTTPVAGEGLQPPPTAQPPSYAPTEPSSGMLAGGALSFTTPQANAVGLGMAANGAEVPNNPPVDPITFESPI